MNIPTYGSLPGNKDAILTSEKVIWWGRQELNLLLSLFLIDSTAVDAANTPTTSLRAGLLLGRKTSDGMLYAWNPDATDGTQYVHSVLLRDLSMLDSSGAVEDKYGHVMVRGGLKIADLLIEGTLFASHEAETLARRQMQGRFFFDDDPRGILQDACNQQFIIDKTADFNVAVTESGSIYHVRGAGAVVATLPTIEAGLIYKFVNLANQNLTITGSNNIVTMNDLAASTIAFSTANEKIGGICTVEAMYVNGTLLWVAEIPCKNTATVT